MSARARLAGLRDSRGFSMIEVLIALLVLAFGLLGFAMLQTLNLRFTQGANYRTEATNLAYDLLDQMRANRLMASQYPAAASFTANTQDGKNCPHPLAQTSVSQSANRWKCQVAASLGPESSATVTFANGQASVVLQWAERTGPDTSFQVTTRL